MRDYGAVFRVGMSRDDEITHSGTIIWSADEALKAKTFYEKLGLFDAIWLERAVWREYKGPAEAV